MKKPGTSKEKAFQINKDKGIYGAFAEIGAGQETVNFFYRAGLASQTVAKSMSAYDMTVSDEIYGKQTRYVCKERLFTMLHHDYRLLQKRLKNKIGKQIRFFVFATTAVTGSLKKKAGSNHHAWMGLRFQAEPLQDFSDMVFHVGCLDKNRLAQHEALGILGVNLIHACFRRRNTKKQFISALRENLSKNRVEIQSLLCKGPAFKKLKLLDLNLETLSQNLSSMALFSKMESSEFLPDAIFNKSPILLYGDKNLFKKFKEKKNRFLKSLGLSKKQNLLICTVPKNKFKTWKKDLKNLSKDNFLSLVTIDQSLENLKTQIQAQSLKPLTFVVSEDHFTKQMFKPSFYKTKASLKSLKALFDNNTKVAVMAKSKNFSVRKVRFSNKKEQAFKDGLISKKQLLDLKS